MKIFRYFLVGGIAATVDFSIFAALVTTETAGWFTAGVIGFSLATSVNYLLSIRHVFESCTRFTKHHEVMMVFLASGVGLACNQAILYILIIRLNVDTLIAKLGATAIVFCWNYLARSKFIFREKRCSI
jgi:putative flippase GtrA